MNNQGGGMSMQTSFNNNRNNNNNHRNNRRGGGGGKKQQNPIMLDLQRDWPNMVWKFSCYGSANQPNMIEGDIQPEEMRFTCYQYRNNPQMLQKFQARCAQALAHANQQRSALLKKKQLEVQNKIFSQNNNQSPFGGQSGATNMFDPQGNRGVFSKTATPFGGMFQQEQSALAASIFDETPSTIQQQQASGFSPFGESSNSSGFSQQQSSSGF
eukprot:CAMPEP_0201546608 /NCGR_PEP_ID=MMETSP0173_2-20130828/2895_1 /ASSEMBLY_ACC=CAM_ASM_000268 /TAXON_ID=218659 /ORGANISM="Vexillifera sp., Strain DIVA3 564/2" /LENGTH=212 /DNA_ID=CAMNT_0047955317 /DNA_START=138 /DNA_END=773 /DNA_ORIENTATION=-